MATAYFCNCFFFLVSDPHLWYLRYLKKGWCFHVNKQFSKVGLGGSRFFLRFLKFTHTMEQVMLNSLMLQLKKLKTFKYEIRKYMYYLRYWMLRRTALVENYLYDLILTLKTKTNRPKNLNYYFCSLCIIEPTCKTFCRLNKVIYGHFKDK